MKNSKILCVEELENFHEYYFYIYENYLILSAPKAFYYPQISTALYGLKTGFKRALV
ncbi:MAG: hypothetical protein K9N06_07555 [Candidatus Cloacimonetes bacterium]|nr:hypothetical protein [Candidatus Cloacimonadota bacterium]